MSPNSNRGKKIKSVNRLSSPAQRERYIPTDWGLGRSIKINWGADGEARVATIKIRQGLIKRICQTLED